MARVRIVKLPKALSGLEIKMQPGLYGTNGNRQFNKSAHLEAGKISQQPVEVRDTLQPVDRNEANLEAEKGETAVVNVSGIPAHFKIGGKRHSQGGTPLNLPDNSFIFSDTAKMKIKDPHILAQFGMKPKRGGYTPAEISKKYDINKFRKVLADPNSEDLERKTAEMMIANYNEKLAKLAIAQESVKGFPQGIPVIAMPYIESMKMDPGTFLPDQAEEQMEGADSPDAETGEARYGSQVISKFPTKKYGGLPKAQYGRQPNINDSYDEIMKYRADISPYINKNLNIDPNINTQKYVGKGWYGDEAKEEEFATGENKASYNLYKQAMLMPEKNQEQINKKKAALNEALITINQGLEYKTGWGDWTQAGKLKDLKDILGEEHMRLDKPEEYKKKYTSIEDKFKEQREKLLKADSESSKMMTRLIGHFVGIKNDPNSTDQQKAEADNKLAEYYSKNLSPTYRSAHPAKKVEREQYKDAPPLQVPYKLLYDTKKEGFGIKEDFDKYIKPLDEAYKKEASTKAKGKLNTEAIQKNIKDSGFNMYSPTQEQIDKLSPEASKYLERLYKSKPEFKKLYETLFESANGGPVYRMGGDLPKAQLGKLKTPGSKTTTVTGTNKPAGTKSADKQTSTKGTKTTGPAVSYDVADEEARAKAAEKNYEFVDPSEEFKFKDKTIGPQTGKTGYKIDPESGFYYDPTGKKGVKPGKKGLDDFVNRHKEIIDSYPGGEAQWRKDQVSAGGKKNKAMDHVVNELNKRHREISGHDLVDPNKPGAYVPGVELFNLPGIKTKAAPATTTQTKKEDTKAADRGNVERRPPMNFGKKAYAPWWMQDIVKTTGAALDLARIKRYLPWQATPETRLPEATFYDPTRELAANAEQANIQTQGLAAFTGPQALSARSAQIQGQALKNAADIMGRYNNMNVQLANQLSQERTGIMNQAALNKANLDTQLYDKYTIANQQFDNAKAMARQNLRQSYIDAITNRAKTQALNTLYPNFYTDPSTGGFVNKTGYASINPTKPGSDHIDSMWEKAKIMSPNDPQSMFKILIGQKGTQEEDENNPEQGYLRSQGYT